MASQAVFDPITFLRLAPAISATASLLFARDQQFFLAILARPENRALGNQLLPTYFKTCFKKSVWVVVGFLSITIATSVANLRLSGPLLHENGSYPWYVAGASLALGHLAFFPAIAPSVQALLQDSSKGNSIGNLDSWLKVNATRSWTADLGAWVCSIIAVVKTLVP